MAGAGSEVRSVAVTGADGFIGRALVAHLRSMRTEMRAITRATHGDLATADATQLVESLRGVDVIFHLAARAHVMHEREADPEAAFHAANVVATERVARAARDAGVGRFVLASSAKVAGEASLPGKPLRIEDDPAPQDAYARSKWDAERALSDIADGSSMSTVVLRLPLVYGPGVRGNFRTLWDAVARRQWLPFAAVDNRRSMIGLGNLAEAFAAAIAAPSGTYFVADAESVSTPQLIRAIAAAQQVDANLAYVPVPLLRLLGKLLGRSAAMQRLTSSLEVDSGPFRAAAGYVPSLAIDDTLRAMAGEANRRPHPFGDDA
ncbi:MAG: NAD-dependent epimerase/dehydratase family protein [Betaproteobacteria bacterium]